ncbi:4'-phosphopantetheinyl transferase family protein [Streptomyces sp. NPDC057430]|uniref:4'-phosphopantetheinyl transferase family protein n=1 Tax=unclassified Streptomyces TaxID=2593676 RepID=UPI0036CE126A
MTEPQGEWRPAPARVPPDGDGVHVWRLHLDVSPDRLRQLAPLLGTDETARARRCALPRERDRFVAARGAVRAVLSRYTGVPAERLTFDRSRRGRPRLSGEAAEAGEGLDFNLSHSGGAALIAVARGARVGVDVEEIDPALDHRAMARRFLNATEGEIVEALPGDAGRRMFFSRWTRREAYAKMTDGAIPRTLTVVAPHVLWDLAVGPDACAALMTARPVGTPQCWTWDAFTDRA